MHNEVSRPNRKTWLNLPIFFSTFLQHEKVHSDNRFLVKVRSCGHFLVSAKSVT